MLGHCAIEPLREQAKAIIPSLALEGLAAGLRSLNLIREIATLYGLRPGLSVMLGLVGERRRGGGAFPR
jgi:hypothetical protein